MGFNFQRRDWLVIGFCAVLFSVLVILIDPHRPPTFDEAILLWLGNHLQGTVGDALLLIYRLSGVHFTAFLGPAALLYLLMRRWWRDLRLLVMAAGGILAPWC